MNNEAKHLMTLIYHNYADLLVGKGNTVPVRQDQDKMGFIFIHSFIFKHDMQGSNANSFLLCCFYKLETVVFKFSLKCTEVNVMDLIVLSSLFV